VKAYPAGLANSYPLTLIKIVISLTFLNKKT